MTLTNCSNLSHRHNLLNENQCRFEFKIFLNIHFAGCIGIKARDGMHVLETLHNHYNGE